MNIFIDESGSFVSAPTVGSWNSIVAYVTPEFERRRMSDVLLNLKRSAGVSHKTELKLRAVRDRDYFNFLRALAPLGGILFSVATDAGLNQDAEIEDHRTNQAERIIRHKDKMIYESGRRSLQDLSDSMKSLSPQLYVQLQCQLILVSAVIRYGTLYFVQRYPRTLGRFRWRVDQKNVARTVYEQVLLDITPGFLQTIALHEPMPMLRGADYSALRRFEHPDGLAPTYLQTVYGLESCGDAPPLNIGKVVQEDFRFVDSKTSPGIQIADLLAAGLRRCLRLEFRDNRLAALLLARLMPDRERGKPPVHLLTLSHGKHYPMSDVDEVLRWMESASRPLLSIPV